MQKYVVSSPEETQDLAAKIAQQIQPGQVLSLVGRLGSGKTTFTQGLAKALGIQRVVKSPTYTIVKEYPLPDSPMTLYHLDAYRLEEGGADTIDLDSFMHPQAITVIEWAEFIKEFLPEEYTLIEFEVQSDGSRIITQRSNKE